jgi:hypothetical protein
LEYSPGRKNDSRHAQDAELAGNFACVQLVVADELHRADAGYLDCVQAAVEFALQLFSDITRGLLVPVCHAAPSSKSKGGRQSRPPGYNRLRA